MKINKIKINQYGKLENIDIDLKKFNIVYGKNEAGKSTMLSFIQSMFYGISKNKNKKLYSDYDQYKPWLENDFSGNIDYTLDNGKKYYIFRNFEKKNLSIYDENNNDVSNNFTIDKKDGNQFFVEQTGLTRDVVKSTLITEQNSVEIDTNTQNSLLQKIVNISETGEEETSYKKAKNKLDKMFLEEIGTDRSSERPINKVKDNIQMYFQEIREIKQYEDKKYDLQNKKNNIQNELNEEIENKDIYEQIKDAVEQDEKESEKINIKNKIIDENKSKIDKLENAKIQLQKNKISKINYIFLLIIIAMNVISLVKIRNIIVNILLILLIPIYLIILKTKSKKSDKKTIESEIKVLKENNSQLIKESDDLKEQLLEKNKITKETLAKKYGNNVNELFNKTIYQIIEDNKENINNLQLELHKIQLDKNNIEPKLEELIELEEKLDIEQRKLEQLEKRKRIYEITNEIMEESYEEMKNSIVPKFTKALNENVKMFSNENYNEVIIKDGILVKLKNGEYVPIEKLSIGTIEEIYLALRLSMINELSKEKMPIILDEAFAYFDDDRLANTLEFLSNVDNQVIILTCTNREQEILDKQGIKFNYIKIN